MGAFFCSGGLGRWDGWDGREEERVAAGEVEVDGGGLDISQTWDVWAADNPGSSSCHVMAYVTQLEIRLGLSYLSGFCT